jgi:hypothetical protein
LSILVLVLIIDVLFLGLRNHLFKVKTAILTSWW